MLSEISRSIDFILTRYVVRIYIFDHIYDIIKRKKSFNLFYSIKNISNGAYLNVPR